MGRFGFECRTRSCTIINADENGDPSPVHPKEKLVGAIWIICIVLFVVNVAVYIKVKVMNVSIGSIVLCSFHYKYCDIMIATKIFII